MTRKCSDCGGDVSTTVSKCPHCGRVENAFHLPNWAVLVVLLSIGVMVFIVLAVAENAPVTDPRDPLYVYGVPERP